MPKTTNSNVTAKVPPTHRARLAEWCRRHPPALAVSLLALLAAALPVPPLSIATGEPLPAEWVLQRGVFYALLAPLVTLWDQVSLLSLSRLRGFLAGLLLLFLAWRIVACLRRRPRRRLRWAHEAGVLVLALAGLLVFVASGALWHSRPMARLAGLGMDDLVAEIHAHTNYSHDVRGGLAQGFDVAASRHWHERAGFDVVFITDHNTTRGWEQFRDSPGAELTQVCPGIEISTHEAHILVLGDGLPRDAAPYRGSVEGRARLLADIAAAPEAVSIASLPEYRGQAERFAAEGVHGFEIVSASPKGNELTRVERDSVVALARRLGMALVGAGDQHGYGATPMVWNVIRMPGWRMADGGPCAPLVARFRSGGPDAAVVVERTRLRPEHALPMVLTPLGVVWMAWATASPAVLAGWLGWIWAASAVMSWWRARRGRAAPAIVQASRPHRP